MADNNKIVHLNTVREERKSKSVEDQRVHARLDSDDRLFTQVVLSADTPELVGTTLSCRAINMSVGGVQFRTDRPVPAGSLLDLWIDVSSRPGKFFLSGEVRWSRPSGGMDDEWYVGVQLKSGAATDIIDWRDYHAVAAGR